MNIRMIVTDLDRTLLRSDKTISDYTVGVLNRCREQCIKIVFATARYFRTIDEWLIPTIHFHPDIIISSNGAYVYSADKVWYQALLDPEFANKLIAEIHTRGGQITAGTSRLRLSERPIEQTHVAFSEMFDFQTPIADNVHYIDYRGGKNIAEDIPHLFSQIRLQGYVDSLTTFVHRDARKGLALAEIIRQLSIGAEEVVGFGDDVNDVDFFPVCGTKVAVDNAVDEIKILSDCVCPSNDEDGVAKWLEVNVL
jgi:Cof subfamily protein (haloacid dehalogenase superfamily)